MITKPLHKDCLAIVEKSAPVPVKIREIIMKLCGNDPNAQGFVDNVCEIVLALQDMRNTGTLQCGARGWTLPSRIQCNMDISTHQILR